MPSIFLILILRYYTIKVEDHHLSILVCTHHVQRFQRRELMLIPRHQLSARCHGQVRHSAPGSILLI